MERGLDRDKSRAVELTTDLRVASNARDISTSRGTAS